MINPMTMIHPVARESEADGRQTGQAASHQPQRDQKTESTDQARTCDQTPEELDHRGIRLPPRHRVGGIITPQ